MSAHHFTPLHSSRNWIAPLGLALAVGLVTPAFAQDVPCDHKARMSSELAQKLPRNGPLAPVRIIVSAPQEEVDRLAQTYDLTVGKRLASGAVFGGSVDQINSLA